MEVNNELNEALVDRIAKGEIIIVTLPNGTTVMIAPDCLNKYYKIFQGEED